MTPYSNGELAQMEQAGKNAEHCVCCGAIIPEGRQVCPNCETRKRRMTIQEAIDHLRDIKNTMLRWEGQKDYCEALETAIGELSKAKMRMGDAQEWNNHTVACLLAEMFGDTCACNFNGIDEWLPYKCELIDSCPIPGSVACWEQFLKHRERRKDNDT